MCGHGGQRIDLFSPFGAISVKVWTVDASFSLGCSASATPTKLGACGCPSRVQVGLCA